MQHFDSGNLLTGCCGVKSRHSKNCSCWFLWQYYTSSCGGWAQRLMGVWCLGVNDCFVDVMLGLFNPCSVVCFGEQFNFQSVNVEGVFQFHATVTEGCVREMDSSCSMNEMRRYLVYKSPWLSYRVLCCKICQESLGTSLLSIFPHEPSIPSCLKPLLVAVSHSTLLQVFLFFLLKVFTSLCCILPRYSMTRSWVLNF